MADRRQLMLYPLVKEGALVPGPRKLSCSVGGHEYFADLSENGEIIFEGRVFRSPSAFSVYVKRKVNPSRKADDGWTSVKYGSNLLSHYRGVLNELTGGAAVSGASGGTHSAPRGTGVRRRRKRETTSYAEDSVSETDDELYSDLRGEYTDEYESGGDLTDHIGDPNFEPLEAEPPRKLLGLPGRSTRGKMRVVGKSDEAAEGLGVPEEFTFVQCCACKKWRRLSLPAVALADWQCSQNPDPEYASCAVPQESSDEGIDGLLQEQAHRLHMAKCRRAPLGTCSEREFESDLYDFLEQRGEESLAMKLRNKQITCNNHPIDIYGLYREVIRHGGFVNNERYDETNRWKGGINFAGEVFPKMRNWTANNRATSVGNQLHCNYRKFLLAYELAHRAQDLGMDDAPPLPGAALKVPEGGDALAFLADVASKGEEADERIKSKRDGTRSYERRAGSKRGVPDPDPDFDAPQTRRRRTREPSYPRGPEAEARAADAQQIAAALRDIEGAAVGGRHPPGTLLLASDPTEPQRQWAVFVVAVHDLPRSVLMGGTCGPRGPAGSFPMLLPEAAPGGSAEDAYPVVVMGTRLMGWVDRGACKLYTPGSGQAAMAQLSPLIPASEGADAGSRHVSCAYKSLKLAAQYSSQHHPGMGPGCTQGQAAGCSEAGEALADLEARLPPGGAVLCSSWDFWQEWRDSVLSARTAAKLAPQVLLLAHQLHPDVLRRGASATLLDELRSLLEMGPSLSRGQPALAPQQGDAWGFHTSSVGPTVLGISDAITTMHNSIDWSRWRRNPAGPGHQSLPLMPPRGGRNGFKTEADEPSKALYARTQTGNNAALKGLSGGSGGSASHPSTANPATAPRVSSRPSRLRSATPTPAPPPEAGKDAGGIAIGDGRAGEESGHAGSLPAGSGDNPLPLNISRLDRVKLEEAAHNIEDTGSGPTTAVTGNTHDLQHAIADVVGHVADLENASATAGGKDGAQAAATDSDDHHQGRGQVGAQGDKHEDLSTGSVDTQGSRRAKGVQGVTSPHKAHVPSPEHMAPPTSGPV